MVQTERTTKPQMTRGKRVYLVGMPGVGKSVVARQLAFCLGWTYLDIDACVVCTSRTTIADIFELEGESAFRKYEADCVRRAIKISEAVIATGGGTPVFHKGMELMLDSGVVIYLEAGIVTLMKHLEESVGGRPLLTDAQSPDMILKDLLNKRVDTYRRAHFTVQVDEKTPEQIVEDILEAFDSAGRGLNGLQFGG